MEQKSHGGKRAGSGRPLGSGRYGEPTKAIRVPLSLIPAVKAMMEKTKAAAQKNQTEEK